MKRLKIVWIIGLVMIMGSCKKEPFTDFDYYQNVIGTVDLTKKQLLERLRINPNGAVGTLLPNKVLRVVSLRYKTKDPLGNEIYASGTVTFPVVHPEFQEMGAVLGVHFTMGSNKEVPSQRMASHESIFALFGYVVVAPDYIGYGLTQDKVHPYHHAENTGEVSLDLLFAAKEYLASLNYRFPRNLTIMGYSEGGYASLACLKMIEERYPGWLRVKQVFAGAGAYDLSASYDDFIRTKFSSQPVTIPMLMLGLNYGDSLNMDFNKLFKSKLLANYRDWILSKRYTTDEISAMIGSTNITDFLAPEVFDVKDPNTIKFRGALAKNSLVQWTPKAKITLLHGTDDTIVPVVNSKNAYEEFKKRGCNVSLHLIKGKDHKPAGNDFYTYCILKMITSPKTASTEEGGYDELIRLLEQNEEPLFNF